MSAIWTTAWWWFSDNKSAQSVRFPWLTKVHADYMRILSTAYDFHFCTLSGRSPRIPDVKELATRYCARPHGPGTQTITGGHS